jgi:hypothetical protein
MQTLGKIETEIGHLSSEVKQIEQLDDVKARLIRLEAKGQIMSHAQLSATTSQYPSAEGSFLKMESVDSIDGNLEFDPRRDATSIKILKDGSYFLIVAPQLRRIANFDGKGCLTMWLAVNEQDLANSSIKHCFGESEPWDDTAVSVLQAVLQMHVGETIQVKMRSHPGGQVGAVAIDPGGPPLVPAAIVSLFELGG